MGTIDLALILKARDAEKYKTIITRAANLGYHDFKFDTIPDHPEYADCICPKMQLVEDLSVFPELNDIRKQVIDGKYDEPADGQDQEMMRGWLIQDGAADSFFTEMGLEVPTEAERLLKKAINN